MSEYSIELTISHFNNSITSFIDDETYVIINHKFEKLPSYFNFIEIPEIGYIGIIIENHFSGDHWYIHREKVIRKVNNIIETRIDYSKTIEKTLLKLFEKSDIPDSFFILENKKLINNFSHKCSER